MLISDIGSICALQACMEGFQVVTMEQVVGDADTFVSTTGHKDIVTVEYMK